MLAEPKRSISACMSSGRQATRRGDNRTGAGKSPLLTPTSQVVRPTGKRLKTSGSDHRTIGPSRRSPSTTGSPVELEFGFIVTPTELHKPTLGAGRLRCCFAGVRCFDRGARPWWQVPRIGPSSHLLDSYNDLGITQQPIFPVPTLRAPESGAHSAAESS